MQQVIAPRAPHPAAIHAYLQVFVVELKVDVAQVPEVPSSNNNSMALVNCPTHMLQLVQCAAHNSCLCINKRYHV